MYWLISINRNGLFFCGTCYFLKVSALHEGHIILCLPAHDKSFLFRRDTPEKQRSRLTDIVFFILNFQYLNINKHRTLHLRFC